MPDNDLCDQLVVHHLVLAAQCFEQRGDDATLMDLIHAIQASIDKDDPAYNPALIFATGLHASYLRMEGRLDPPPSATMLTLVPGGKK